MDLTLPLAAAAMASTVCTGRIGIGSDSSGDVPGVGAEGGTSVAGGLGAQKVGLLGSGMEVEALVWLLTLGLLSRVVWPEETGA